MDINFIPIVFYGLAALVVIAALAVILVSSPIYSALFLAVVMLLLAALFFVLEAYFLAGVQLITYAGAVVVLFVMVLMMFDLRKDKKSFSGTLAKNIGKALISGVALGIMLVPVVIFFADGRPDWLEQTSPQTKDVALSLFAKHVFTFEIIGVLLLVVLIGSVTLAKAKGGTHAKHDQ